MMCQKTWPSGGGAYFPYTSIMKILKLFLSETTRPVSVFIRNVPSVTLCQGYSSHDKYIVKKYDLQGEGLIFSYIFIWKTLKKFLVRTYWTDSV